jgi:hypothetical protein
MLLVQHWQILDWDDGYFDVWYPRIDSISDHVWDFRYGDLNLGVLELETFLIRTNTFSYSTSQV